MSGTKEQYLFAHDGKVWPAATAFARDLMRGDAATYHLGYSIGNALIAAAETFGLDVDGVAIVAERVVESTTEHHSATSRPLVVAYVDGGIVQDEQVFPGLGLPEFWALDFDRADEDPERTADFVEHADSVFVDIRSRGGEPLYLDELDQLRRSLHPEWPVDHEMGKE